MVKWVIFPHQICSNAWREWSTLTLSRPVYSCLAALGLACSMAVSTVALCQETVTDDKIDVLLVRWDFQLDFFDKQLERTGLDEAVLEDIRDRVKVIQVETSRVRERALAKLKSLQGAPCRAWSNTHRRSTGGRGVHHPTTP